MNRSNTAMKVDLDKPLPFSLTYKVGAFFKLIAEALGFISEKGRRIYE